MKKDIILCGVGGQGILSVATIIGEAATKANINLKQAEVHGMSQRGGDVQSNLRLSTDTIYSDLIQKGGADLIISMEPMEARCDSDKQQAVCQHSELSRRTGSFRRAELIAKQGCNARHRGSGQGSWFCTLRQRRTAWHGCKIYRHHLYGSITQCRRHHFRKKGRSRSGSQSQSV